MSTAIAQFIGLYVLIVSFAVLVRKEAYVEFAYEFAEDKTLRYVVAFLELAAGLAIVLFGASWVALYEVIITVFGGLMVVEAVFFLLASEKQIQYLIRLIDRDWYWTGATFVALVIGLYLTFAGFGLL